MPAVAEEGHVALAGLAQVFAEGFDDLVAGCLPVGQAFTSELVERRPSPGSTRAFRYCLRLLYVVDAAPEFANRPRVVIDSDEKGVDRLHDSAPRSIRG